MLNSAVIDDTNIINIHYTGSLAADEIEETQDLLAQMTKHPDQVQLLLEYGELDLGRVEPEAAWKDLHTVGLLDDMQRIAIVADQQWLQMIAEAIGALTSTEVRTFGLDQRDAALAWLAA